MQIEALASILTIIDGEFKILLMRKKTEPYKGYWVLPCEIVGKDMTLEEKVVKMLKKHELTIVTAESCTGGMLSSKLINVPGVSDIFKAGLVTYANQAKREILGVGKKTLKKYGAVSPQTAEEMILGAVDKYDADVAVSVTGIAGPDGGTKEKPVGLVYIGCYVCGQWMVEVSFCRHKRKN